MSRGAQRATRAVSTGAVAALLALATACSLFAPHFVAPRLSLVNVELVRADLLSQHLRVRVHVQNPNDRVLPVKGLTYTLYVEGESFAQGESAASFTVPALGEAEFDMNVVANATGALLRLLRADARANAIEYRLAGRVDLSSGWLRSVPFEERGTFRLH